jgi:hypothetical protein
MSDHHEVNSDKLLTTDDAMEWATEFVKSFRGEVVGDFVDEGLMVAWFASAIETAKVIDRGRRRKR